MNNQLTELRFHGRGGQGVVTVAQILAKAAAYEGKQAQSVPYFGPERRGAAVVSYARVSEEQIWLREPVYAPDIVVVLDDSLFSEVKVLDGMKEGGLLVVNTTKTGAEIAHKLASHVDVCTVDASNIAARFLKKPMVNILLLGAISTVTDLFGLPAVRRAIEDKFPEDLDSLMNALQEVVKCTVSTRELGVSTPEVN